jgi:hypothetical protein
MPFSTRLSSTRRTPRGLLGRSGLSTRQLKSVGFGRVMLEATGIRPCVRLRGGSRSMLANLTPSVGPEGGHPLCDRAQPLA